MSELNPGDKLYGYCNGYFGRDSYSEKTVIATGKTGGVLWIVAQSHVGYPMFASGMTKEDIAWWRVDHDAEYDADWEE